MDKQVIFEKIKAALIEDFDLEEERIVPEARLYEDLELDSIVFIKIEHVISVAKSWKDKATLI